MNLSIPQLLEILLAAARRRRRLIAVPILIFAMLSVAAVFLWPRTYATRTLLMLQERQASDALSAGNATREARLKADEIDTLLKSERVLASAILDFNVGKKALTARELEGEIRSLRRQIGVNVVGGEFIEIELKQSERVGSGERLSIIMTRFFERLLTREDSVKTARQFALEQRRRDLDSVRVAIEGWTQRAIAAEGSDASGSQESVARLQTKYAALEQKLMASASDVLPGPVGPGAVGEALADELRAGSARLRGAPGDKSVLPHQLGTLKELESQLELYQTTGLELTKEVVARARGIAHTMQAAAANPLYQELQSLDARFNEALAQYEAHQKRSKRATGPALTPFGLIAPDSIRIIDEPRDPASPTTSLLKILVACLVGGVGLGIGLAALAEQLDDRIYDPRGLDQLVGVGSLFRLAPVDGDGLLRDARMESSVAEAGSSREGARGVTLAIETARNRTGGAAR